jgi:hypothetical protein
MPNNYNYRSNVPAEVTFLVSRISRSSDDSVLLEILPGAFAFDAQSNIELHFYSQPNNALILSLVVEPEDIAEILKSHIVTYDDGTLRNYIKIDFSKLFDLNQTLLLPGDYKVVMNFFTNEIGKYFDRTMFIQEISDSKTEVQLAFADIKNDVDAQQANNLLSEFVEPSFEKSIAVGVAEKVFFSGVNLGDDAEGVTVSNLPDTIDTAAESFVDVLTRIDRVSPQVQVQFKEQVNTAIQNIYSRVKESIIEFGDSRIQRDELDIFIQDAVNKEVEMLRMLVDPRIKIQ